MAVSDQRCHVMVVAASRSSGGADVCDRLASFIADLVTPRRAWPPAATPPPGAPGGSSRTQRGRASITVA
jgi:hypothetical protein